MGSLLLLERAVIELLRQPQHAPTYAACAAFHFDCKVPMSVLRRVLLHRTTIIRLRDSLGVALNGSALCVFFCLAALGVLVRYAKMLPVLLCNSLLCVSIYVAPFLFEGS